MFKTLRGRIITIVVMLALSAWQLYANPIKRGLDLQGGTHLVLEVSDPEGTMTPEARAAAIDQAERVVRTRVDEFGVEEPLIQKQGSERLVVELAGVTDSLRARDIISRAAFLEFKLVLPTSELNTALPRLDRAIVAVLGEDSLRALGRDVEAPTQSQDIAELMFGRRDSAQATDTVTAGAPADTSAAPAATDTTELRPFTSLLNQGDPGAEGIFLVATEDVETAQAFLAMPEVQRALPRNVQLHWGEDVVSRGARTYRMLYVLEADAFMDGRELTEATAGRDPQFNQSQVLFELSRTGGRAFERFTSEHVGDFLAIVLDGEVVSAPVIRDRISTRGQIDLGAAPLEEANDLAVVLRAGALPVPLQIMEERYVGPSLGADSIQQGMRAGLIGLFMVVAIMVFFYRMAGFLAVLALGTYVLLMLGVLAGMGATLTLPGVAGFILSIGMAVDSNVLIFERIREELAAGRATRTAVDEGFSMAMSAIVDSNLTTLFAGLVLFQFGTGPVQGFAVTLSIGIIASFVSAIYVTRTLFLLYLSRRKASDPISI
jgi:preprotein translocase subunit SecD